MFNLGVPELILILVVGLVVFGPKKLPEVGRSVGKGLREFKKAMNDIKQTIDMDAEFKEVAEIKKEVTDIKTGLKDVILGSDMQAGAQSVDSTGSIEPTDVEASSDSEEAGSKEDPRLSWVKNSTEWTMPEWVDQIDTEASDKEIASVAQAATVEVEVEAPEAAQNETTESLSSEQVKVEQVRLSTNEDQTQNTGV